MRKEKYTDREEKKRNENSKKRGWNKIFAKKIKINALRRKAEKIHEFNLG